MLGMTGSHVVYAACVGLCGEKRKPFIFWEYLGYQFTSPVFIGFRYCFPVAFAVFNQCIPLIYPCHTLAYSALRALEWAFHLFGVAFEDVFHCTTVYHCTTSFSCVFCVSGSILSGFRVCVKGFFCNRRESVGSVCVCVVNCR